MRNPNRETIFRFKQFSVINRLSAMRVGTDGVLLGAWSFRDISSQSTLNCLDVGCGTGLISLMLAQRFANITCTGIEIDDDAATEANENFRQSPWSNRLSSLHGNFIDFASQDDQKGAWDLIISNPPFFTNGIVAKGSRGVARHTDSLPVSQLLNYAGQLLKPNGRLSIIAPFDQTDSLVSLSQNLDISPMYRTDVQHNPERPYKRTLIEFIKTNENIEVYNDQLSLHDSSGAPTLEYRHIVEPFYLRIN